MESSEQDVADLRTRLERYPAHRYPVQHATAQFHLGTVLLQTGAVADALIALTVAEEGFAATGLALERAKATNMHAVALRTSGAAAAAVERFAAAAIEFGALEHPVEQAAATYNLGLASLDAGNSKQATTAFARAAEWFLGCGRVAEAGAATRERGVLLLAQGELGPAVEALFEASELAFRGGDTVGGGAAANALGLARLASSDTGGAIAAFQDALGAHPRSVRPAEHAMAKANLALAHERAGDTARAVLAALQALGVSAVPGPVRAQAQQLLARLPAPSGGELFAVLDEEPEQRWAVLVREEVLRWSEASPRVRADACAAWVREQLARSGRGPELAESLFSALLELPPAAYERIVRAIVVAVGERGEQDAERFRAAMRSGMARFPMPQLQRLAATFDRIAAECDQPVAWS